MFGAMESSNVGIASNIIIREYFLEYCVVPENIHTPPTDGQWKFLGGGGAKR